MIEASVTHPVLDYQADAVVPLGATLYPAGKDIEPAKGELVNPYMEWKNWHTGFAELAIPGMSYEEAHFMVNYYQYANKGDRTRPQTSRSQSVVSEWRVDSPDALGGYGGLECKAISVFYPVYDGIGFWIGKRRREENISHYTPEEEKAIAFVSVLGALGIGTAAALPSEPGHIVYQCIWAPGKVFDSNGVMLPSAINMACAELGLSAQELTEAPQGDNETKQFRLFGTSKIMDQSGRIVAAPFTSTLAEQLRPAWQYVRQLPGKMDPPDPNSY